MFSFSARKKSAAAQRYIRRLVDLTIPNRAGLGNMERYENRHNRSIPTLLCPWEQNRPIVSKAIVAITKDFSGQGIGIVLSGAFDAKDIVVGFCLRKVAANEPLFFLGVRRTSVPIGGGFWQLGIEFTEFMNQNWHSELEPLFPMAQKLLPPSCPRPEDARVVVEALSD